jgi:hypothetical protein
VAKNSEYDDAENNRLALSGDVHNWSDDKSCPMQNANDINLLTRELSLLW